MAHFSTCTRRVPVNLPMPFEAKAGRQSPQIPIQHVTCMRPAFLSRDALNE